MNPPLPPPLPVVWSSPYAVEVPRPRTAGPRAERVDPVRLWGALSHGLRWRLVLRMAAGEEITAPIAARGGKLRLSAVRKNLAVLKRVGAVVSRAGLDRRSEVFFIPAERRPEPGVLDFGSCRITLAEGG